MKKILLIILVCVFCWGCEAVFVENISDQKIEILAPKDGTTIPEGTVSFSWKNLSDVDEYQLRIATPNLANASQIILDTVITKTSFNTDLIKNSYEWQIIGLNAEYQTQEVVTSFTVN